MVVVIHLTEERDKCRAQHKKGWDKKRMTKREKTVQIEKAALKHVEDVFNSMNWNSNEIQSDFGHDLHIQVFGDEPPRRSLPLEFKAQVKGTERHNAKRGSLICKVDATHVTDWLESQLPILLVVCRVEDASKVVESRAVWVDEYVYGKPQFSIWPRTSWPSESFTFQLPESSGFSSKSKVDYIDYIRSWTPATSTINSIREYLSSVSNEARESVMIQRGPLRFDLFALPISYNRLTTNECNDTGHAGDQDPMCLSSRTVCILGKPASGKTTAVNRLLAHPPEDLIPVPIRSILPASVGEVRRYISRTLGIPNQKHVQSLLDKGRILLVVDGVSEISQNRPVLKNVSKLALELNATRFLVTCRTADYMMLGRLVGFDEWEIKDLDDTAQDHFLDGQSEHVKQVVAQAFLKEPQLRKSCRNQLLFLLAVELIPGSEHLGLRRTDLYGEFISRYLGWLGLEEYRKRSIIDLIADIAFEARRSIKDRTLISNRKLNEMIKLKTEDVGGTADMLYQYGLLEKIGGQSRFFQETLQEYLCALYLVKKGVLPCGMEVRDQRLYYDGVELNDVIKSFYAELGAFDRLSSETI